MRGERQARPVVLLRPVPGTSAIHELWAGTKLIVVFAVSLLLSFYPGWIPIGLVAVLLVAALRIARIPRGVLPSIPVWLWILIFIGGLISGREDPRQLSGPVGIAQKAGEAIQISFLSLLTLMGAVSVSIGLINLFPVPMLDGGHLLFYAIESVRGKPLSERAQEVGFRIGLAVVLMLMVFAAYNDISGFFPRAG